jgi:hypothetical protein
MHAMKTPIRQLLLPAAVFAVLTMALATAGPASAATWQQILRDCVYNDGLKGDYTRSDLNNAKRHVTGERIAYTECAAEIQAALGALGGSGKGDGGKGGPDADADLNGDGVVTPEERRKAKQKEAREDAQVADVNSALQPDSGTGGTSGGSPDGGGLPLVPLIVLLVLAAATAGTWYAARRNPAIANALRRVALPSRRG